jgi:alkylation response protein AidB-like acyl-CoA dehydrogenase
MDETDTDLQDTGEQAALRETVRDFCRAHAGAGAGAWKRLAGELGLTALAIGEEHGGMGATVAEVAIAAEELGRVLLPVPYLSTALAGAVLTEGDAAVAAMLLPGVASGALTAAFAFGADVTVTDGRLSGAAEHVLDGAEAGLFLVPCAGDLFAVRAVDATVTPVGTLDQTRSQAAVTFQDSLALVTGASAGRAEELMWVLLAAESVAAAEHCLEVTVAYLKTRTQFGRPIGTFQALRHRCADLAVEVSAARATAQAAVTAAVSAPDSLPVLAPLAKRYCVDVFSHVTAEMIQLHGGIGFTWEHEAHRYFKRAKTSQLLLGTPGQLRQLIAHRAGLFLSRLIARCQGARRWFQKDVGYTEPP